MSDFRSEPVRTIPYRWPYDGGLAAAEPALVVAGADVSWAGRCVDTPSVRAKIDTVAAMVRRHESPVVFVRHTDRAARASGSGQLNAHRRERVADELAVLPEPGDVVIEAAGMDGFFGSSLDYSLTAWGGTHLAMAGFGLEGPVHSTLRSANDRGYECLVLTDACAALAEETREGALSMVTKSGGIFGALGTVADLAAIHAASASGAASVVTGACPLSSAKDVFTGPSRVDSHTDPGHTAVLNIDWQHDFCGLGGYVDSMGYDLSLTRAGLGPTAAVLEAVRARGFLVLHTREGHQPDLSDCPPNKLWRSRRMGAGIGDPGPAGRTLVRGEPGWEIVPEVAPLAGEPVVDKPGKGAFYATDLDLLLRNAGVTNLVLTGITTDVCVQSTMREATDRGYECLLLSDCTGATDPDNREAALKMVTMQGGLLGSVATSAAFLKALH
jgi:nicotinamidase-related amidase